jgi:hypothetical protein
MLRKISETTRDETLGLLECYITGHIAIFKGYIFNTAVMVLQQVSLNMQEDKMCVNYTKF